jgi:hypothetical protein
MTRGEPGYVKNVYTHVIHTDSCSRRPEQGLPWQTVARRWHDRPCASCLPEGLPEMPEHQVRQISNLPIWVCSCNGILTWSSEDAARKHSP